MRKRGTGRWGLLAGLSLTSAGLFAYVVAPASVMPLFTASFDIGKPAGSAAISAVFLTWAVLQVPGGFVLDRADNRRLVALGAGGFLVAGVGGLLAASYPLVLVARLACGASGVFVFVGSLNVLGRVLPEDRQALGTGVFVASPPLGVAIGQATGPLLAVRYGWRGAMLAYVLLSALGLAVFLASLREPVTTGGRVTVPAFLAAVRNPAILLVSTVCLCSYAIWTFLVTWMPTYGTEVLGIDLAAAGAAAALVPLAGIVARPGGGWVADRIGGRLRPLVVTSLVASGLLLVALSRAPSAAVFAGLLALSGAAVNLAVGLYFVYVTRLADAATRATSLSVLATAAQVGNLVAPVAGGWLIESVSWTAGFGFAAALAAVGLVAIAMVPRTAT